MQSQWHIHDLCILIMVWHTFYFASLEHNHSSYGQCSHYSRCSHTTYNTSNNGPSIRIGHWMDKTVYRSVTTTNISPHHSADFGCRMNLVRRNMEFMCMLIASFPIFYHFVAFTMQREGKGLGELVKSGNVNVMQCQVYTRGQWRSLRAFHVMSCSRTGGWNAVSFFSRLRSDQCIVCKL